MGGAGGGPRGGGGAPPHLAVASRPDDEMRWRNHAVVGVPEFRQAPN